MGMIRSRIYVVSDVAKADSLPKNQGDELSALLGQKGAGGCCSGGGSPAFAGGKVPVDTIGLPIVKEGIQEITITVNAKGYFPAAIMLQKGLKARIRFRAEELNSCNNPVVFPEYHGALDLAQGQLETPPIPIVQDFTFQCGMGMIHGYVKVVDDLSKVNIEKVRLEIGKYRAKGGGGCCGG
jgi:plastocyanin domain-containing protein